MKISFVPSDANDVRDTSVFLTSELGFQIGQNTFRNMPSLVGTLNENQERVSAVEVTIETSEGVEHIKFNPFDIDDTKQAYDFMTTERGLDPGKNVAGDLSSIMLMAKTGEKIKKVTIHVKE